MKKPLLVDAIYINRGGALTVLNRLIDGFVEAKVDFVLLKDARCPRLRQEDKIKNIVVMNPSLWARHCYYKKHRDSYRSVLCMANVPPTIKMHCPVHTYFHNLSVLMNQKTMEIKMRIKNVLKRKMIALLASNTDAWIVQTSNTENLMKEKLPVGETPFYQYPIYTIPKEFMVPSTHKTDYLYVGEYTHAKGHDELLEAWRILHQKGYNIPLHLTCNYTEEFLRKIKRAVSDGVQIVNHGFVNFSEMADIYQYSKAIVYPSLNESLGLGIVEGIHAGCDIIASDLPFTHSVCKPSEVFNPVSPDSIAEAVIRYEKGLSKKSELTIHDCIKELIRLVS